MSKNNSYSYEKKGKNASRSQNAHKMLTKFPQNRLEFEDENEEV